MQIIIETDKESKESLEKLGKFLLELAGAKNENSGLGDDYSVPAQDSGLFNMFDQDNTTTSSSDDQDTTDDDDDPSEPDSFRIVEY
ncbi:hypothetical protein GOV04_04895 [Candidatus Woesearchaeota archaeon]|nr:hypothetical protein [Candidatus Woesearchaeota archaeon]